MRKTAFISIVIMLSYIEARSQMYVGLGLGYGVPATNSVLGIDHKSDNPANTFSNENVYGSYGMGSQIQAYAGYWFSDLVGAEIGVNYLAGKTYTFTDDRVLSSNVTDYTTDDISARSWRIDPAIRVGLGHGDIHPYILGGLSFGVANRITDEQNETFNNGSVINMSSSTLEYSGGMSLGIYSALGLDFHLNEHLMLDARLTDYSARWAPAKADYTNVTFNGADQLDGMTNSEKHFVFVDRVDQTMNNSAGEPTSILREFFPMNSVGLTIGVHYDFGSTAPSSGQ